MFLRWRLFIIVLAFLVFAGQAAAGPNANAVMSGQETKINAAPSPDFDGNGVVGFLDFLQFVNVFRASRGDGIYEAKYDLNGNGVIDFPDFLLFADNFGKEVSALTVDIPDVNLRAIVENSLDKASGAPITRGEMASLTRLEAPNKNISDLTGLEFAIGLTWLDLGEEVVNGIGYNSNKISDLLSLSCLTNLTYLNLSFNEISDVSALSNLTNLTWLNLSINAISDVSVVSNLTNLTRLWIYRNNISDISPLSNLTNLTELALNNNNAISDVSALSNLTNLTEWYLFENNISDLWPLVANTGLSKGDLVDVRNNPLSAISIDTHIPALQSRGVDVRFGALKPAMGEKKRDMIPEKAVGIM